MVKLQSKEKDESPVTIGGYQVSSGRGKSRIDSSGNGFVILVTYQVTDVEPVMALNEMDEEEESPGTDLSRSLGADFHQSLPEIPIGESPEIVRKTLDQIRLIDRTKAEMETSTDCNDRHGMSAAVLSQVTATILA